MLKCLLFFVLIVIYVHSECEGSEEEKCPEGKAHLDRGTIALSGQFLYQLSQSRPNDNFVTSATSILTPLAQLVPFTEKSVSKQLLTVLNLCSEDELKCVYLQETASYKNQDQVEFEIATKYFANENYPLSDKFKEESKKYFDASGQNVDFSHSAQAADIINGWVANKTHDRIKNLVSPDSLDASTVAVLVNAIYFLGNWKYQFNPKNTQKRDFTQRNKKVVQLDTMYQEHTFKYAQDSDLKIKALVMPYKNQNFSFLGILPEEDAFVSTVSALRNPDTFINITKKLRYEKVQVYLPKMTINTYMNMEEMLRKVNVTEIFDPNSNGFKGILKNNKPLYISSAVQKAFMKVDETGTEAAAATALTISRAAAAIEEPQIYVFNANRSFLFYILFQKQPMFSGVFIGAT
ncbi:unnamed protein product [Arctia plantaginis]|uniref:Serpin domain-containing protein n=1 Tax=Arctia plantaginis TaxID=874455 RepID=A0A8S1AE31_ARCPL|nr:unnamed protein product [Arctia plantaginis]